MTSTDEPRAYTREEMQRMFLEHLWVMVHYWATTEPRVEGHAETVEERIAGFAFTVLADLDGSAVNLPAFNLYPAPHPDDEEFHRNEGENWWPSDVDLHGNSMLHEMWHDIGRELGYLPKKETSDGPKQG
jgi:hypothetical protein